MKENKVVITKAVKKKLMISLVVAGIIFFVY